MRLKKIMIVCGTRPEAIKLAPLYITLKKNHKKIKTLFCATGQHQLMLNQVLNFFDIKPDYNLKVMKKKQSLSEVTKSIMSKLEKILIKTKPDLVIVHGDTMTTFTASLSAFFLKIKVAHVEAGLRTNNIHSPFPEELNRQLVSRIAEFHFAPTQTSKLNLLRENIDSKRIFVTGNTVIDALKTTNEIIDHNEYVKKKIEINLKKIIDFKISSEKYILVTAHRRENYGDGIFNICRSIKKLSNLYDNLKFIFPVHLNPNIITEVNKILKNKKNIYLLQPQSYINFVYLIKNCYLVMTDSGGIQEEAPYFDKPVLVMRNISERPEGVKAGTIKIIGSDQKNIVKNVSNLINNNKTYNKMCSSKNPYGDGRSSIRICNHLLRS